MVHGDVTLDVMKSAGSWADGLKTYQNQKIKPLHEGPTPVPHYVSKYEMSRAEAVCNPITQKFRDPSTETQLANWESAGVTKTLNKAWDKQLLREQHFDILNQLPKKGHIHEVPYKQRLKPPSLITANHVRYNILSTLGEDVHHWAPPGRRPPRIPTPPKKEAEVTKVNKPREYDILTNKYNRFILQYREHHDERSQWEMDQKRATVVDKYWETHDFDALTCSYYDSEKETFYQRRLKEMLLSQGTSAINKLPPTLAASESLMYDICTGVVKDPARLRKVVDDERLGIENRAAKIGTEDRMRVRGDANRAMQQQRSIARISHQRHDDTTSRGFHILSNKDYDLHGEPPLPHTTAKPGVWQIRETLAGKASPQRTSGGGDHAGAQRVTRTRGGGSARGEEGAEQDRGSGPDAAATLGGPGVPKLPIGGAAGGVGGEGSRAGTGRSGRSAGGSLSGMRIRSGGF